MESQEFFSRQTQGMEGAELLNREARMETLEIDAEQQEFARFNPEQELLEEGLIVSEGYYDELGAYHPGNVLGVEAEAAEMDSTLQELSKDMDCWTQQMELRSCSVACQTMVANQLFEGAEISESAMLQRGRENNWYNGVTLACDEGKILESLGLDVEHSYTATLPELEKATLEGDKVIAHVDSMRLMFPDMPGECAVDHAVEVLRVERTGAGTFVILNDPGVPNGRGIVYPEEVFLKAWNGDATTISKEG